MSTKGLGDRRSRLFIECRVAHRVPVDWPSPGGDHGGAASSGMSKTTKPKPVKRPELPEHAVMFAKRLKEKVHAFDGGQTMFARKLGVKASMINKVCHGKAPIPMSWLTGDERVVRGGPEQRSTGKRIKLSEALGLSGVVGQLFYEDAVLSRCPFEMVEIINSYRSGIGMATD